MAASKQEICEAIDGQIHFLKSLRSVTPYMGKSPVGQSRFRTAPIYVASGYDVEFDFGRPVTKEDVSEMRKLGHWVNQNFVVRLCAMLEYNKIIPRDGKGKIDWSKPGAKEIDLLRRLRNKFSHTEGRLNQKSDSARTLYSEVKRHFNVVLAPPVDEAVDFPLSIDVVLLPMAAACKKYVEATHGT